MSTVTLFGPPQSSYVRTARMVCSEKGVAHALEPVELGSDAHGRLHPWRRVPALQHGELRLIETSAIARYVDEAFDGPKLTPATPAGRAVMEQWISVINCYAYDSCVRNYALRYILPKLRGQPIDRAAIEAGVPNLQRDIARLDGAYAGGAWIAGETLSLADLFVAPIVATLAPFPEGKAALDRAKHLSRAFEALSRRPSFQVAHAGLFG